MNKTYAGVAVAALVIVCLLSALITFDSSAAHARNDALEYSIVANCGGGAGTSEDIEGEDRIIFACANGEYGYVSYARFRSPDFWPFWD